MSVLLTALALHACPQKQNDHGDMLRGHEEEAENINDHGDLECPVAAAVSDFYLPAAGTLRQGTLAPPLSKRRTANQW
jgi:hypothetical protein